LGYRSLTPKFEVKMIGKPSGEKLHAGLDEGGTGRRFMGNPKRARSWKQRIQPRVGLKAVEPVLYSTLGRPLGLRGVSRHNC